MSIQRSIISITIKLILGEVMIGLALEMGHLPRIRGKYVGTGLGRPTLGISSLFSFESESKVFPPQPDLRLQSLPHFLAFATHFVPCSDRQLKRLRSWRRITVQALKEIFLAELTTSWAKNNE